MRDTLYASLIFKGQFLLTVAIGATTIAAPIKDHNDTFNQSFAHKHPKGRQNVMKDTYFCTFIGAAII